jgi:hypothetical protein
MKASVELGEGKYNDSFEEETKGLESITKLISESIQNDNIFSFNSSLSNLEIPKFNFSRFQSFEIKDKILMDVINEIKKDLNDEEKKIVLFEPDLEKKEKNEIDNKNESTSIDIYNSINKFVHKILHGKKNKNIEEKICIFTEENSKNQEVSKDYKNTENDKKICNLKEKNKIFEFIVIKSLMISITNYMSELIDSYLTFYEKIKKNYEKKIEEQIEETEDDDLLKSNNFGEIFSEIYNDFVAKSNKCSELEEYFMYSLESFKNKYQINFTLSELFTDIFWNSIFHNKILCNVFSQSYSSEDYGDIKIDLRKIMKLIFDTNIPLKHQIVELLGLNQIEINEKKDLMTLIVAMKNKYHSEIIKSEKEKENLKQNQRIKELKEKSKNKEKEENNNNINNKSLEEENNINSNNKEKQDNNENKINLPNNKNEIIFDDNIKCNIIKAHDIRAFKESKLKAATSFLAVDSRNNNVIIGVENNIEKKTAINEKENNNDIADDGIPDLTHKTVDEIINYINDDRIVDKSTKGKRKKKSRKNKKAKKEEAEQNKNQLEDSLVLKFKEDLTAEFIHANTITKIKHVISDNWIKLIST